MRCRTASAGEINKLGGEASQTDGRSAFIRLDVDVFKVENALFPTRT